tara:strand:- start:51 stop:389 length:339 start_codon:yes stop_codon:yes gene_type:complete
MTLTTGIISRNEIILITNNKFVNKLTIDLINLWNKEKSSSILKIVDLDNFTITSINKDKKVKRENNVLYIEDIIQKYDVYSYPSMLVLRENNLIENIFGNYNNIYEIVNYYL